MREMLIGMTGTTWRGKMSILRNEAAFRIAHALPRRVAYWAAIRVAVHGTVGEYSNQVVPELTIDKMLKRWHDDMIGSD
jgi:hypothetical protein